MRESPVRATAADARASKLRSMLSPPAPANPSAVPPPSRIAAVDALRGFALLGILVVNITFFGSAFTLYEIPDPAFSSPLDDAARWFVAVLFTSKFYVLFSFLFGYSFTLQIDAAMRRGAAFAPRFLRRLLGLFAIGAAHAVLLWQGDILTTYAVLGLVLLALRGLEPRRAVRIAVVLLLLSATFFALAGLDELSRGVEADTAQQVADATAATDAWRGSIGEVISQRVSELPTTAGVIGLLQAPTALAMFLLGLAAGKRRLFADLDALRPHLRRTVRIGLPLGLAGSVAYAYLTIEHAGTGWATLAVAFDVLTAPLLSAAYAAVLLLAVQARHGRRLTAVLAPTGRMALSNYLLQSIACSLVFTGYGLGLVGRLAPAAVLGVAAAVYAAQLAFSAWWLGRHPYGPAEWLLRWFTNWARPPWRLPPPPRPSA